MHTFTYREESGHEENLDAETMEEALELAEELCKGGEWGEYGASVSVWVVERDEEGGKVDRQGILVEIEPDHDALIRAAGGDVRCDHDWTGEGEGGLSENPGVWSVGGTALSISTHCRLCGLHRRKYHCGSQRNPGEHDTVEYHQPESWCAECERVECECD